MKKNFRVAVKMWFCFMFFFFLHFSVAAANNKPEISDDQIIQLSGYDKKEYDLTLYPTEKGDLLHQNPEDFLISTVSYGSKTKRPQEYGDELIVWKKENGKPILIWRHSFPWDFSPRPSWLDFNQDGKSDLFILRGFEDEFNTYIFFQDPSSPKKGGSKNFLPVYKTHTHYSVVLDIDQDGRPEILHSGATKAPEMGSEACSSSLYPENLKKEITEKYNTLAGKWKAHNFDYGYTDDNFTQSLANLFLFEKIKIFVIKNMKVTEKTSEFSPHLQWRIALLKKLLTDQDFLQDDTACKQYILQTLKYLNQTASHGR